MSLLTNLSPLSSEEFGLHAAQARPSVRRAQPPARPPRGFRPLSGEPTNVRFGGTVPEKVGRTRAARMGLAYERRVHDVLSSIYGESYRHDTPILYSDRRGARRAIPDGILSLGRTTVVIEVKLSHTERAWWQLRRLYLPLLRCLLPATQRVVGVELCCNFDPELRWPEAFTILKSLHTTPSELGVLQWRI